MHESRVSERKNMTEEPMPPRSTPQLPNPSVLRVPVSRGHHKLFDDVFPPARYVEERDPASLRLLRRTVPQPSPLWCRHAERLRPGCCYRHSARGPPHHTTRSEDSAPLSTPTSGPKSARPRAASLRQAMCSHS